MASTSRTQAGLTLFSFFTLLGCGNLLIPKKKAHSASNNAPTADLSRVARPAIVTKAAPLPGFMRGINLGNGLDAPHEGEWGVVLKERHF